MSGEAAALSVIVLVPDRIESVAETLESLRAQDLRARMELVFVTPVATLEIDPETRAAFANVQVIHYPDWRSTAASRIAGIRVATAPVVAMVEDHCFPTPGWASALVRAHAEPWAAVGPAILNANPNSVLSWVNLAIEYGPWLWPIVRGPVDHVPGHNSSYKRDLLLDFGDRLEALFEAESVLHWELRRGGHQVGMEPDARSRHQNFGRFWPTLGLRFHGGRHFAANRALDWSFARRLAYALASPLIPLLRTVRTLGHMRRAAPRRVTPAFVAALLLMLVVDALGEAMGYATGHGRSVERLNDLEFNRRRFLAVGDEPALS
jgi:glycosyltransferase involved in cell wall biosynthesis